MASVGFGIVSPEQAMKESGDPAFLTFFVTGRPPGSTGGEDRLHFGRVARDSSIDKVLCNPLGCTVLVKHPHDSSCSVFLHVSSSFLMFSQLIRYRVPG